MVFLSIIRHASTMYAKRFSVRCPKPDKYWKRSMYYRMMWKYYGRRQHIFSLGVRYANRALRYSTRSGRLKRNFVKRIWDLRLSAACKEHGLCSDQFQSLLSEANIGLNRKVLTDLSIYEPRTFQSLTTFAKQRNEEIGLFDAVRPLPPGVLSHEPKK